MGFSSCVMRQCVFFVKIFKWLPVILITTIACWSYYAYVIQLCFYLIETIAEKVIYLIVFHLTFIMFVWSYWQTVFSDPRGIPKYFELTAETMERLDKENTEQGQQLILEQATESLPITCRNWNGTVRYCEKCRILKPDRAHHCSVCSKCVLKMDHHCPWVNNCVAYGNYKFFVLFLGYAILYCLFIAATTCQYFIRFWTTGREGLRDDSTGGMTVEGWHRLHILFLFFLSIMFAISLVSLFCYHCYLVTLNRTTLESFRPPHFRSGPDKRGFYLGRFANFKEVFGEDKRKWFLPLFSSLGDGLDYPVRPGAWPIIEREENLLPSSENGVQDGQQMNDYRSMGETSIIMPNRVQRASQSPDAPQNSSSSCASVTVE